MLAVALVMACCFGFSVNSYAYWFFGTVGVNLGKTSVSLTSGQSETVSVSLSPASSDQLPGCGMEECPRICGDKNCYNNEYGQCICNGSTLSTYYPTATVSSDNTSVATATYNNGAVTITGVGAGEATITVVGSLRQYYDSPEQTIAVNVSANTGGYSASIDSSNPSSSGSSGSSGNSGDAGDTVAVTQVDGTENNDAGDAEGEVEEIEDEEENTEEEAEEEDGITMVESDKGTIWFVPITGLPQGKEQFETIMGDESQYVDFQLKDDAGNVIYAWEFWGSDVERAEDMVLTFESSRDAFEDCSYGSSSDSLYLDFAEEGEFVGKTTISDRVSDYFSNGDVLNLYRYNPEDDTIESVAEELAIDSGYVNMELEEGGQYILSTEELLAEPEEEEEVLEEPEEPTVTDEVIEPEEAEAAVEEHTGLSAGAIAAIVIIAAAVAALIIFLAIRAVRKRKSGDNDGPMEGSDEE